MKRPRITDADHLAFVRQLPCIVCGDDMSVEAAHVRYSDLHAGKRSTGMAEKPDDKFTVPLCGKCHRAQHRCSERGYWEVKNIDPVKVALALYVNSGDHEAAGMICRATANDLAEPTIGQNAVTSG